MPQPLDATQTQTTGNDLSSVQEAIPAEKAPNEPRATADKWAGNRHRLYMDADLKALCDLACKAGHITFSTLLQRAARKYVRHKARDLRKRLAALPPEEQARLSEALQTLFTK